MTESPDPFFQIVNLSKDFEEGGRTRTVLKDANASFQKGEFTAILGKSGSGKSTLLNVISGIDQPDSGEVWLGGQNISGLDDRGLTLFRRQNIGFIFQFFNLIPTLTVWENILLPAELNGKSNGSGRGGARRLLEEVGLADRANTFPDRLSGGEQQRVAIARAMVNDPLLVLADEPTGNLDEETGKSVLALLDRLTRQAGKNLLMVTHSREAAGIADRTLVLHNGKLFPAN